MKKIKQAILDKILYIGEEIPSEIATDKRPKFVLLGTPQELIDETEIECSCGEPWTLGVIHRKDKPCYYPERK
ncbi:MAG: hypothetical protein NT145_03640 [Elusimicrobia bacterium]|nr:hypothetical protein [Elusimicrobiota bacterium]